VLRKQDNDHNADKPRTQSDRPQINTIVDETIQHTKEAGSASKKVISGSKRSHLWMQKKSVLNENKGGFHF